MTIDKEKLLRAFPINAMRCNGFDVGTVIRELLAAAPTPPQPVYDESKERELFEVRIHRIAVEKGYQYMAFLLKRDESGEYQTTWVDMAWLGWSERAHSRAKSVEVGDE